MFLFCSQSFFVKKLKYILTRQERSTGFIFLGYMFIAMILETVGIGLVAPLIKVISEPEIITSNNYMTGIIRFFGFDDHKALVTFTALALIVVFIVKNVFLGYFAWYKIHFLSTLRMEISNRLFKIYLCQPYTFHLQRNSGQLIQNISTEVTIFTGRLLHSLATIISETLVLLGVIVLLFLVEPKGALIIVVVLGIVGGLIIFLTRAHMKRWGEQRQFHDGKRIQHLQQGLGGVKEALFLGKEQFFYEQYQSHNTLSTKPDQKQAFLQEMPRFWFEVLAILGVVIMILVMNAQERELSTVFSILGIMAAAAFRLMPSVTRTLAAIQSLRYSIPVLDTLSKEFKLEKSTKTIESSTRIKSEFSNMLSVSHVSFSYPEAKIASLHDVSLNITQGECVGIIGSSGAGKSTLVDTLLGLLSPDSGKVTVDGKDIFLDIRNWQNQIGYVPQSIFLVDDSLRNNIAFGVPNAEINDKSIERAIQTADLGDFVSSLPDGVNTFVGERGIRLSGGQRQRIGIARALYYDPKVLVLDEATSALDNDTENQIMKTVHQLSQDKTIIIIAHRLSTVERCDRLYRLDKGEVVEEGKPEKLLVNNN